MPPLSRLVVALSISRVSPEMGCALPAWLATGPPARVRSYNQTRKDISKNKLSTKSICTDRSHLCFLVTNKGLTNELIFIVICQNFWENKHLTENRLLQDCGVGFKIAAIHLFYGATV